MVKKDDYALTTFQRFIWSLEQLHPVNSIGNNYYSCKFEHSIDFKKLQKAINTCIKNHSMLRLKIHDKGHDTRQYIADFQEYDCEVFEFDVTHGEELFNDFVIDLSRITLAMPESNLFYFALVRYPDGKKGFLMGLHRIISDALSAEYLIKNINKTYDILASGIHKRSPSELLCSDFLTRQEKYADSSQFTIDEEFWDGFIKDSENTARIQKDTLVENFDASNQSYILDTDAVYRYRKFCRTNLIPINYLITAALCIYLSKKTTNHDFIFSYISNQCPHDHISGMLPGMCENFLIMRTVYKPEYNFIEFVNEIAGLYSMVEKHWQFPFDEIIKKMSAKSGPKTGKIEFLMHHINDLKTSGCSVKTYHNNMQFFPIVITTGDFNSEDLFHIDITYHKNIYTDEMIKDMANGIVRILNNAMDNPSQQIGFLYEKDIELFSLDSKYS